MGEGEEHYFGSEHSTLGLLQQCLIRNSEQQKQKPGNLQGFGGGRGPFIQYIGLGSSEYIWRKKEKTGHRMATHRQMEVWLIQEEVNCSQN